MTPTPPWERRAPAAKPDPHWEVKARGKGFQEPQCDAIRAYLATGPHSITGIHPTHLTGRTQHPATPLSPAWVEDWVLERSGGPRA